LKTSDTDSIDKQPSERFHHHRTTPSNKKKTQIKQQQIWKRVVWRVSHLSSHHRQLGLHFEKKIWIKRRKSGDTI
jgi:hypothetical protein